MMTTMMEPATCRSNARGWSRCCSADNLSRSYLWPIFGAPGRLADSWVRDEIFTAIGVIYATEMFIGLIYLQIELQMHNFDDQDSSLNIDVQRFEHFIVI